MRLVDAEPIEKFITDGLNNQEKSYGWVGVEILTEVHYAPTVDATLVVHAHWEERGPYYKCSLCGDSIASQLEMEHCAGRRWDFCPCCGAKMDGKESKK